MIVVDASALLDFLLGTPTAVTVERRLFATLESLHVPHLLDVEATQVIRRYTLNGDISTARGHAALTDLLDLPLHRYPHEALLPRVWALRDNMTAYDAVYVALAEALNAPLLTSDRRLAAAPGHRARIEWVGARDGLAPA